MQGDSLPQWTSTIRNQAGQLDGCSFLHQPSFSKAGLEHQPAFRVDTSGARATEFSFPNRWRARSQTYIIPSTTYIMVYSVPANPEWNLQALLDKVPDLTKKAIAGGVFLGDIDDIADRDDVSTAVTDIQWPRWLKIGPAPGGYRK